MRPRSPRRPSPERPVLHVILVVDPDLALRATWERELVEERGEAWVAANRARLDLELEFIFGTGPAVLEPRHQGARRARER